MPNNMPDARAINEALRRAREMQSRSEAPAQPQAENAPEHKPDAPAQPAPSSAAESPPASLLDHLMQDKERTLILALLILLSGEGGNTELLFALMYLLI